MRVSNQPRPFMMLLCPHTLFQRATHQPTWELLVRGLGVLVPGPDSLEPRPERAERCSPELVVSSSPLALLLPSPWCTPGCQASGECLPLPQTPVDGLQSHGGMPGGEHVRQTQHKPQHAWCEHELAQRMSSPDALVQAGPGGPVCWPGQAQRASSSFALMGVLPAACRVQAFLQNTPEVLGWPASAAHAKFASGVCGLVLRTALWPR